MVMESLWTSMVLPRNSWTISMIWLRDAGSALILISMSSRLTEAEGSSSTIFSTSISLLSCFTICSSTCWLSTATWTVIRERSSFSVGPTASDSML